MQCQHLYKVIIAHGDNSSVEVLSDKYGGNKLYAADVTNRLLSSSSNWQTDKLRVFPEQSTENVPSCIKGWHSRDTHLRVRVKLFEVAWTERLLHDQRALSGLQQMTALSEHCTPAFFNTYGEDHCLAYWLQQSLFVA